MVENPAVVYATLRTEPLGDSAVLLTFGTVVSREISLRVRSVATSVGDAALLGVTDVVPAYTTIAVYFDAALISFDSLTSQLVQLCTRGINSDTALSQSIEIPVLYDGPDLSSVAERTGLSVSDVIELHSSPTYYAYMLGFVPGFAYLGDLDPALILPRRVDPRQRVPAGSVAIAGAQTAVYPLVTSGGWHIIGSTRLTMFDPSRERPALIHTGDSVRFVPVHD